MNSTQGCDSRRHLALDGACNVRDLGGYPRADGGSTAWRRVLRGDSLHRLGHDGIAGLLDAGLGSVIDLRDTSELLRQPNPLCGSPAVTYTHVPLFARLDLHGRPPSPGVKRPDGMQPAADASGDLLLGLYCDVLSHRQAALGAALTAIADAAPGMVLFHCTVGKDRTGLVAALVLAALGVAPDVIADDYALSAGRIDPIRESLMAELCAQGGDAATLLPLFEAKAHTMHSVFAFLESRYGGVAAYLDLLDPQRSLRLALCKRMT